MATTYHNAIQKLYVAYFNRPADFAGLNYWQSVVEAAKGDTTAVSAAFAGSAEYQTEYNQFTNAGVVTQVYKNLFGHEPDAPGLAFWVNALNTKAMTVSEAVTQIAAGAQGTDKIAYDSKVLVATSFTAALDTPAEQAGYTGTAPNAAAKTFLAGITTAAQATAAIAPAALDASVAAVVKAGVPFSLTTALANLVTANEARAAFLVTADGDKDAKTSATKESLDAAVAAAKADVAALVGGDYATETPGVQAAMMADAIAARAKALVDAQAAVATANTKIAAVAGLSTAVANNAAADTLVKAATADVTAKAAALAAAEASLEVTKGITITMEANGTAAGLIELKSGALALVSGVTETTHPGVTALLAASVAKEASDKALATANTQKADALQTLNRTDYVTSTDLAVSAADELMAVGAGMTIVKIAAGTAPTPAQIKTEINALAAAKVAADAVVTAAGAGATAAQIKAAADATAAVDAFNAKVAAFDAADTSNPLVSALATAEASVVAAQAGVKALADANTKLTTAVNLTTELKSYDAKVVAAQKEFTDNSFALPQDATGVIGATAGSDIYVAGKMDAMVVGFGMSGKDMLFIGDKFTLNTGKLTAGNDSVLEVFLIQNGSDTQVVMETKAFGSNSADAEVTVTLTGVNVADVHLNNGIITVG